MEKYIKYERFEYNDISGNQMKYHFDDLVIHGWDIIYYNEENAPIREPGTQLLHIVIVAGKRQENTLG